MSNQQRTSGKSGSQSGQGGITWQQQFIVGFVGWLILQVLSPKEWYNAIGTFLTLEATSLFLLSSLQKGGGFPTNGTLQFFLGVISWLFSPLWWFKFILIWGEFGTVECILKITQTALGHLHLGHSVTYLPVNS